MNDEQIADLVSRVDRLHESMGRLFSVVQHAMSQVVDVASLRNEVLNLRDRMGRAEERLGDIEKGTDPPSPSSDEAA